MDMRQLGVYPRLIILVSLVIATGASTETCSSEVRATQNSNPRVSLLAFDYPLSQIDEARNLLEQTGNRAIFYVNATEIDVHNESIVRSLVQLGHTILMRQCEAGDETRMEMALGFHVPFGNASSTACKKRLFSLDLSGVSLLLNEEALNWLRDSSRANPMYHVEHLLTVSQLACLHEHMECTTTALGETRYRYCVQVANEYRRLTGRELSPFSHVGNGHADATAHHEFMIHNRRRVEMAFQHLKSAKTKIWRNEVRTLEEVMLLLYSVSDADMNEAASSQNIGRILRQYISTQQFNAELLETSDENEAGNRISKWSNYAVSIILCLIGLLGLYVSTEAIPQRNGMATRLTRALSSLQTRTADFAKVV